MEKIVDLRFDGSLEQGFRVHCIIKRRSHHQRDDLQDLMGSLPANQQLTELMLSWKTCYQKVSLDNSRAIEIHHIFVGEENRQALVQVLEDAAKELTDCFHQWIQSQGFDEIMTGIYTHLSIEDSLCRILLRSSDHRLHELPWQTWKLLEQYKNAEIAFGAFQSQKLWAHQAQVAVNRAPKSAVKILAIFGNSAGIDLSADRDVLTALPKAEVVFLESKPGSPLTGQKVLTAIQDSNCDILFFAGHSASFQDQKNKTYQNPDVASNGSFYINDSEECLTADQLWIALRQAVSSGLKLAIFNSCDGLGISRQLSDNYIPQVIVMRELVPDRVAQLFLGRFLLAYTSGQPLYLAVRSARDSLKSLEVVKDDLTGVQFPHASWLPVIFQNAVDEPPNYPDDFVVADLTRPLNHQELPKLQKLSPQPSLVASLIATSIATVGIAVSRCLGLWMPIEQATYDWFLRSAQSMLPASLGDPRIIQVGLERDDIPRYGDRLNDVDLIALLERLNGSGAIAVGVLLDRTDPIVRDQLDPTDPVVRNRLYPRPSSSQQLTKFEQYLKQNPKTITACQYSEPRSDWSAQGSDLNPDRSAREAVGARVADPLNQLGFQNLLSDHDGVIRRYLFVRKPNIGQSTAICYQDAEYSFGMQLASQFLRQHTLNLKFLNDWDLQIASSQVKEPSLLIQRLKQFSGFYQDYKDPKDGWQVPLKYQYLNIGGRHNSDRFSINQIMDQSRPLSEIIAGKIVIVSNSEAEKDQRSQIRTPFGLATVSDIHAHFISQILDATLNRQRFSVLFLPMAAEIIAIFIAAFGCHIWITLGRHRSQLWTAIGTSVLGLGILGQFGIVMGISLPVWPAAGAAVITLCLVAPIDQRLRLRSSRHSKNNN